MNGSRCMIISVTGDTELPTKKRFDKDLEHFFNIAQLFAELVPLMKSTAQLIYLTKQP